MSWTETVERTMFTAKLLSCVLPQMNIQVGCEVKITDVRKPPLQESKIVSSMFEYVADADTNTGACDGKYYTTWEHLTNTLAYWFSHF